MWARRIGRTPGRRQLIACRTELAIVSVVLSEVCTGERLILTGRLVEDRQIQLDPFLVHQPAKSFSVVIGTIADKVFWIDAGFPSARSTISSAALMSGSLMGAATSTSVMTELSRSTR